MEEKTNVMRILEQKKIAYQPHSYVTTDAVSGTEVAAVLGQDPKRVFKTLVTVAKSGNHYVFVIPVEKELDLKKVAKAAGDKKGIRRYGSRILPMDEVLVLCAIDLGGRPYYRSDAEFTAERIGMMDTEMVREFFYAVSYSAAMNLHFKMMSPGNNHHMAEGMFKAFAKALDEAVSYDPRIHDVLSTKGSL